MLPIASPYAPHRITICSPSHHHMLSTTSTSKLSLALCVDAPGHICSPSHVHMLPITCAYAPHRMCICSPSHVHMLPIACACAPHRMCICSPSHVHMLPIACAYAPIACAYAPHRMCICCGEHEDMLLSRPAWPLRQNSQRPSQLWRSRPSRGGS